MNSPLVARSPIQTASGVPEWFDDYNVGLKFISPTRAVTDDDVRAYVRFSNDVRPLLGQAEHGCLAVPNMYLFCLGVGLLLHAGGGYIPAQFVAFFGFDRIDFHRTARGGEVVRSSATVIDLIPRRTTGLVVYEHETALTTGDRLVSSVQRILVRRRHSDA